MFEIGDIIYAREYHRCSYYHVFGKVVKITPKGSYRIQPLLPKYGERKEYLVQEGPNKGALICIKTEVEPDVSKENGKTYLVNSDSWYAKKELLFQKYESDEKLIDHADGLD